MASQRVLVLQMAKVGSYSWFKAISDALPDAEVHHVHFLHPATQQRVAESNEREDSTQTFANRAVLRNHAGSPAPKLVACVRDGRWCGGPVKILSAIRDPVDRAASLLFFFADFYGHKRLGLSHRDGVSPDFLVSYFIDTWRAALAGDLGTSTFDARLRSDFLWVRDWFSMEIEEIFGIDVMRVPFERQRASLRADNGSAEILCYRFEDLAQESWPRLAASASAFLGVPIKELPQLNATTSRRARHLYREFRAKLALPAEMLEAIYAEPLLNHFYTDAELASFKARWGDRQAA